jgi:hypothetical protein
VGGAAGTLAWTYINVNKIPQLGQVVANARDAGGFVHPLPDILRGPYLRHRLRLSRC